MLEPLPAPPPTHAPKAAWRAWARRVRAQEVTAEHNREVANALIAWPPYRRAQRVLIYLPFGSEVKLNGLLVETGTSFYLTRTWETADRGLTVHRLDWNRLETHRFGYLQPAATAEVVPPEEIELALVPGLTYDLFGTRLGYGQGYYDRFLPQLRGDVPRVGVTLDALVVPQLPRDVFDVPVTHLATESGVRQIVGEAETET